MDSVPKLPLCVNRKPPAVAWCDMCYRFRVGFSLVSCFALLWPTSGHAQAGFPVIEAARTGDLSALRALITEDVDIDAQQGDGATALHYAAHRNDLKAARLLIAAGATVGATNDLNATPLWLAAKNGSSTMASLLLDAGADPNVALRMGETPLMTASRSGNLETVTLLLNHGAAVNAAEHERQQTPLMWAAAQSHSRIVRTLIAHGGNVHARTAVWNQLENTAGNTNPIGNFRMTHGGSSPLLFAARQGDIETTQALIDAGANVNDQAASGASALVIAAHSGHGPLGVYLLEKGADPNGAEAGYTALHAAVLRSQLELVEALLAYGADPNTPLEHGTPGRRFSADYSLRYQLIGANAFWLAAKYGELEIFRTIMLHGGDPLTTPTGGMSTLQAAMGVTRGTENRRNRVGIPAPDRTREEGRALEMTRHLLSLGIDVNTPDQQGNTALHHAVRQDFRTVVELLADRGANPHASNDRDETPISLAERDSTQVNGANQDTKPTIASILGRLGANN